MRNDKKIPVNDMIPKNKVLIWTPALASEPRDMLIRWILTVQAAGFRNILLVFNGPGAKNASAKLRKKFHDRHVQIKWLSGLGSIGKCQVFVTQIFLQSKLLYLLRVDPDGQFPIEYAGRLLEPYQSQADLRPDVVVGFRDEASIGGRMRYFANIVLRLFAVIFGIYADLNCGFYVMNRKAAALLLCRVALPKYPEPRMLVALQQSSLITVSCIVPVLQRTSGCSSIRGFLQSIRVFIESFLEYVSWDRL
jgi:hypothetical protein